METERRLKRESKLMYIPTDHNMENQEDETESGFLGLAHAAISGGISGVFDKFLGCYVTFVRQNMEDMLQRVIQEEDQAIIALTSQNSSNGEDSHHHDSNQSLSRPDGHNGSVYGSATKEFQQFMEEYAKLLQSRCPPEISQQPLGYRLGPQMEITLCYIINTGEYCAEVVPQLEQIIQQKIVQSLSNKVDFSREADLFLDVVAFGVKVLVFGLMDRLEPGYRAMQSIPWANFAQVGEESQYLHHFNSVLVDAIPKIKNALSSSYFNNFCTKLATEILQRYQESILKARRISDLATQQLLLDTYSLKTLLFALPGLELGTTVTALTKAPPPNAIYAKLINGKAGHIEIILKLVGTPEEVLVERFRMLWPDGQPSDLQTLLSLKGTKRHDQQVILEMLGMSTGGSKGVNKGVANGGVNHGNSSVGNGNSSGMSAAASMTATATNAAQSFAATTASYTAASAAAFSSMKSLTQDLSSTARNAVGNLKWGANRNQQQQPSV
eukprot:scaffold98_cov248-Ochromonas_danica.AAC.18